MPSLSRPWGVSAREKGKGSVSVQELNRNPGGRLGCLQERVEAAWGFGWRAGGQPQVRENLDDHCGIFNGGDKRQGAAALGTGGDVDREDPFEQLRPTQAGPCGGRGGLGQSTV